MARAAAGPLSPCCSSASRSSAGPRRPAPASSLRPLPRRPDERRPQARNLSRGIARASSGNSAKMRCASAASVMRLMPTSITVAPGRTQSGSTIAARPIAATTMSARRTTPGKSRVFEWQIVTVAFACISKSAIGFPTMSLRPTTTAFGAFDRDSAAAQNFHAARRRAGHQARAPGNQPSEIRPDEIRPRPSPGPPLRERVSHPPAGATEAGREFHPRRRAHSVPQLSASNSSVVIVAGGVSQPASQAQLLARRDLAAHIDLRRRIFADQHRREARDEFPPLPEPQFPASVRHRFHREWRAAEHARCHKSSGTRK